MGKEKRITTSWAVILIMLALTIDGCQALLEFITFGGSSLVDPFIDFLVLWGFAFVFYFFLKINFTRTRALVYFGIGLLELCVPILDLLPFWTIDVIVVMLMVAAEDRIPALKKLDQAVKTNWRGNIKNAAKLKESIGKPQLNALRRTTGAIMTAVRPEQMRNAREQKIAAQKAAKSSEQENENL